MHKSKTEKYSHFNSTAASFLLLLSAICLCIAILPNGFNNSFVLDDAANINITQIRSLSIDNIISVVANNQSGIHPLSRALPSVSFSLTYLMHDGSPASYRFHNLVLHLLCGVTLFLFIFRYSFLFFKLNSERVFIASCASALWLVHPLLVSTTLYAVQRITQLSTLFTIASLYVALYGATSAKRKTKIVAYFFLFPLFFGLAMMSKENSILIPLYLLILSFSALEAETVQTLDKKFFIIFGWILSAVVFLAFIYKLPSLLEGYNDRNFTPSERLLTQIEVVVGYLKNLFIPKLSSMGLYLDGTQIVQKLGFSTALKLCLLTLLTIISIYWAKAKIPLGILLFFIIGHLLESTIVPLEIAFEHRNYFPSIGVTTFIAIVILKLIKSEALRLSSAFAVLSIFVTLTAIRVGFWSDEHEWHKTLISYHPNSMRTQISYVNYLGKHFGEDAAFERLSFVKSQFNSPLLNLSELVFKCGTNRGDKEDNNRTIQEFFHKMQYKNLSPLEKSMVLQLSQRIIDLRCESIDTQYLHDRLSAYIAHRENTGLSSGSLHAASANILYAAGFFGEAAKNYKKAFLETNKIGFLMRAVGTLTSSKEHLPESLKLAEDISSGKYFSTSLFKSEINGMNKFLKKVASKYDDQTN